MFEEGGRGVYGFNPRPLLLTGESAGAELNAIVEILFQSTPVIANGRIFNWGTRKRPIVSFNPRPLLLTGESLRIFISATTI